MKQISTQQHTNEELKQLQRLPLDEKVQITQTRIIEFYNHFDGSVYVSFSGGKESTVLRDIVNKIYPDVVSVYFDTGLEYPEVRQFALAQSNVDVVHPIMYDRNKKEWIRTSFKQVIEKCGYPVISKEVAKNIREARQKPDGWAASRFQKDSPRNQKFPAFSLENYAKYLDAPFQISEQCCKYMKKMPAQQYTKTTGKYPITGQMASESRLRKSTWMMYGCNLFDSKYPKSNPLSFWTEQDVLQYLKQTGISYASVYGDIVEDNSGKLCTTGCDRTGCMFCMFGAQSEKYPTRFQRLKQTHPKQYEYCMKSKEEGGLGLAEVLQYIGVDYE